MSPNINKNTNILLNTDIDMTEQNKEKEDEDEELTNIIIQSITDENLIPNNIISILRDKGLSVVNISRDGNCMFSSVTEHLPGMNHFTLRKAIVWYLKQKHNIIIEYFAKTYEQLFQDQDDSFNKNWSEFLKYIEGDGNWEKMPAEYILKIIAEMYNLEIHVYSTLNNSEQTIIGFSYDFFNLRRIYLIHLAEMHWCSTQKIQHTNIEIENNESEIPSYIS